MKRAERLSHLQDGLASQQREFAARVVAAEQRSLEARLKLLELQRYRAEYQAGLAHRAAEGISGPALRDFQAFLARLDEAVRQQVQQIARCEAEREFERHRWHDTARQAKAVTGVVERWRQDERREYDRRDQRASDDRACLTALQPRREES